MLFIFESSKNDFLLCMDDALTQRSIDTWRILTIFDKELMYIIKVIYINDEFSHKDSTIP